MDKTDERRREFLIGAGAAAGAIASAGLLPDADAASVRQQGQTKLEKHGAFFNEDDAATVAAFAERLMPGAQGKPGARDANVLNYIDLALAGAYAELQDFYRKGLEQLDAHVRDTYGAPFRELSPQQQDKTIAALERGEASGFSWPSAKAFFDTVRTHTLEGMFADPVYGGNKDFAGWLLVGFPGAQGNFTAADMKSRQAFTRAPVTGLQSAAKTRRT
jgi:gluconate 2-dehydrogenase gamma chain